MKISGEGPSLQELTHRLSECPAEFLREPRIAWSGVLHVEALVFDTLRDMCAPGTLPHPVVVQPFDHNAAGDEKWLRLVCIACWLLNDDWFIGRTEYSVNAARWLRKELQEVAQIVEPSQWTSDADRREELARRCLAALGLVPQGESEAMAQDRLNTLDSVERKRVLMATQAAQQRAQEIREAMRKKAAEEAAAKYTRE